MIQITRPRSPPSILKNAGEKQTQLDCAAYDLQPGDYHSGRESFSKRKPNPTYYNRRAVKDLLIKMHQGKCAYCEKRFRTRAYLHVDHYRPKYGVRQTHDQESDDLPGYYWLLNRWENLLLSCFDCNCIFKRTLFPLENPTKRARSHHDDIARERPLFVDPSAENPRDHIRFDGDLPMGITTRGEATIDGLGLRRVEFREDRLALLSDIRVRLDILELAAADARDAKLQAMAEAAREYVAAAVLPDAEFSSMAIDYIARAR